MADPVDELFTVHPNDFVARRNQVVKALRRERRRDEASEVAARRRPTAPLWALNQLARRHADDVAELLEAGADLPAAQEALLAGDQGRFREAVAHHRQLVSRLAGLGARLVAEAGVSATDQRQDIATALQAASTIPEAAEPFRCGRLAEHPAVLGQPVTGLPGAGLVAVPDSTGTGHPPATGRTPARRTRRHDRHLGAADTPADRDEAARGDAQREAAERERAEREAAERERAEREAAERERAAARARVAAAEEAARRAEDEQRALGAEVADLEAGLERARRALQAAADRVSERADDLADAQRHLRALR